MSNITKRLRETAMGHQNEPAIAGEDGVEPLTFSTLWSQTDAFAGGLQERDIASGDTVVICLSNPQAFLVAFYGALRNGSVPVTMPSSYTNAERTTVLNETNGTAYVTDETPFLGILNRVTSVRVAITVDIDSRMGIDLSAFLDNDGMNSAGSRTGIDVVRQSDTDRGLIAYVGYDDGSPLGVVYTHSAISASARLGASIPHETTRPHHLGVLPPSNPIELLYGVNATILRGGQYHPQAQWCPERLRTTLAADDIDRILVTSSQYDELRASETDGTNEDDSDTTIAVIEQMTSLPERTRENATSGCATNGDATRYVGSPETGLTHARVPGDGPNSTHTTLPDVEVRNIEDGDGGRSVRSPAAMTAYANRPELTDETMITTDGTRWIRAEAIVTGGTTASVVGSTAR
ncbi:class I adenylate-forming enzyme family protein [Natronorubrum daqingense]|uniref:Long-chain acyl-CoA synthetase n=1 Tax=Natronorubrum daqingense TaxID=588898 RepID=A0A1N6X6S6_9EURY|nr:class I adenylate-forming enzyme family protein [Natronorubrum daqingense]APX96031.1 long-chain acyl-CoA synthetase [Natronorubrum daqingense]SIQ98023.1 long-chain acyl-CoA synthetase [Natronorubrum daqingense]